MGKDTTTPLEDNVIEDFVKRLAQGPNFGTVATIQPDGSPATHVMWVDCDDEHVLLNTELGRAKLRNIESDPRVSVVVWDASNPLRYVEVRGRVVEQVAGSEARAHNDELSFKYEGKAYDSPIKTERVVVKIAPDRQRSYGFS
jgi:PPOX class probable F420-dependent enzyme